MDNYINDDFLLETETSKVLYHNYAEGMPIFDFHGHLSSQAIVEDAHFRSITELWLDRGEYQWRAMRANGILEKYVTGEASDWEKFSKWAETVPSLFRSTLYQWLHLELKRVFGVSKVLNPDTAKEIYDQCNEIIADKHFSARNILKKFKVDVVCTANDMTDTLVWHKQSRKEKGTDLRMLPTWKPDRLFEMDNPKKFNHYIEELSASSDIVIRTYGSLLEALRSRHAYFHSQGCRMSDVSIDGFYVADYTSLDVDEAFMKIISGKMLDADEQNSLKAALLIDLCEMDYKAGWVQQYHIGVQPDLNSTMFKLLGRHRGFDGMNDRPVGVAMGKFFNRVYERGLMCRTVVYNLNPKDFDMFAVVLGCFQDGSFPGKLQLGSAWWYLNNERGIRMQLDALSHNGLLSRFIGTATDSHCFLSYVRHEYFRRVLCKIIGRDVERGELPACELERIGQMISSISYTNAKKYFNF